VTCPMYAPGPAYATDIHIHTYIHIYIYILHNAHTHARTRHAYATFARVRDSAAARLLNDSPGFCGPLSPSPFPLPLSPC